MAVTANTNETYSVSTIREDLQDALISISPTETPFMTSIGRRDVKNTYFEWPVVELAATSTSNVVIEGESARQRRAHQRQAPGQLLPAL